MFPQCHLYLRNKFFQIDSSDSGSGSSRPPSTSPTIPVMPGGVQMDSSPRPPSRCDSRENKIDDLSQDRADSKNFFVNRENCHLSLDK